jgi:hypothetical protein
LIEGDWDTNRSPRRPGRTRHTCSRPRRHPGAVPAASVDRILSGDAVSITSATRVRGYRRTPAAARTVIADEWNLWVVST